MAWRIVQWPLAFFFVVLSFALLYFWGPDTEQDWTWITPGSLVGVILWVGVSLIFRVYLHYFNSYSKTYGSLGAVIILLYWLFISGLALLIGGEIQFRNRACRSRARPSGREGRRKKVA